MTYEDFKDNDEASLKIEPYIEDIVEELNNDIFINYYGDWSLDKDFKDYLRDNLIEIYLHGKKSNNK